MRIKNLHDHVFDVDALLYVGPIMPLRNDDCSHSFYVYCKDFSFAVRSKSIEDCETARGDFIGWFEPKNDNTYDEAVFSQFPCKHETFKIAKRVNGRWYCDCGRLMEPATFVVGGQK